MAANLHVKSESWLNLAIDQVHLSHKSRFSRGQFDDDEDKGKQENNCKLQKRHSIGGEQNYYSPVEFNNKQQQQRQARIYSSNSSIANATSQRHLLIRLRQRNYQNNRSSSTATLSSNLSNSVELNTTLLIGEKNQPDLRQQQQQQQQPIRLKNEPRRLQIIKDKLQRNARGRGDRDGGSPRVAIARSLSSLSERINGKLENIRHSWKHFLYHYNHNRETLAKSRGQQSERGADPQEVEEALPLGSQVNRSQLTNDWIARHHCFVGRPRPRSLQITSSPHLKHLNANDPSSELNFKFYNSHLESPATNQQQVFQQQQQLQQTAHSASSTTLVSQQVSSCSPQQLTPIQRQTTSNSSNNNNNNNNNNIDEEEEKSLESLSSGSSWPPTLDRRFRAPMSKSALPAIVVAKRDEANEEQQQVQQQTTGKHLKQASTSDYWSTVTTSSGDYYTQARNMTPQQQQQQQQQVRLAGAHLAAPANLVSTRQPILLADQDYYLEVAKASQQLLGATNRLQVQPTGGPLVAHNQLERAQMCLPSNLANLIHTDMPFQQQQIQLQSQQQAQQQLLIEDDYDEDYAVPADESCRLDRSQVELVQMIGEGQKGYVFLGKLQSKDGQHISDVAIKTLKYETDQLIDKLMREAAMMRQLEHPHIIKFIGVCPETPALIAMELAEFGEVKQYLKLHKQLIFTSQLVLFTFQISTALSYLESKHYVHRDVAARNVLVCSHNCVKLADFGLSRNLQTVDQQHQQQQMPAWSSSQQASQQRQLINHLDDSDKSLYVAATKGKLPVRWLAPESLAFRRFTSASDVWMFAVCSWELFQFGELRPWSQIRNNQVLLAIEAGQRLAQPASCPMRLYQLMLQCWSYAPIQRPKFRDLKQNLWSIYLNERAREQLEMNQQQEQQRVILANANWQNQERIMQVINSHNNNRAQQQQQQQQQKRLLEQQAAQNLYRLNKANILNNQLIGNNQNGDTADLRSPVTTTTAANNNNSNTMASNFSGYSSTTATGEHSNNSSRSSSMGSLARNHSLRAQNQKQPVQYKLNQMQPAMLNSNKNNQTPLLICKKVEHQPEEFSEKKPPTEKQQQQQVEERVKQEKIDANMRRFERAPGRLLQKQRSQSSIVKNLPKQSDSQQRSSARVSKYGLDDHALLANSINSRRAMLQINVMEDGYDDDDEDSSDSENNRMSKNQQLAGQRQPPNEHHMRLLSGYVQHVRLEPTYEGIHNAEVNMMQGHGQVRSPSELYTNTGDKRLRGRQAVGIQKPVDSEEELIRREQKLCETLQALKTTPLKAKLANGPRQSSLEPTTRMHMDERSQVYKSNASSPGGPAFAQEIDAVHQRSNKNRTKTPEEMQEDDQQRLALHQRLLGRIRPLSGASKNFQRRSMNMDHRSGSDGGLPKSEKVDQSLEILESLIAGQSFASDAPKHQMTAEDRRAHYQAKLLRDMNNNLQIELRHRLLSRKSRPAQSHSFPDREL